MYGFLKFAGLAIPACAIDKTTVNRYGKAPAAICQNQKSVCFRAKTAKPILGKSIQKYDIGVALLLEIAT